VTTLSGTPEATTLSVSGLPSGVSSSFSPTQGTPPFTSTLTLNAAPSVLGGSCPNQGCYNFTVTATPSLGDPKSAIATLEVSGPGFVFVETSVTPSTVLPGDTATTTVKWKFFNVCLAGCVVKGDANPSWNTSQQLAILYDGPDKDAGYGVENVRRFGVSVPLGLAPGDWGLQHPCGLPL